MVFPAVLGIVTAWLVTPPLAYLLGFELGWGVAGGWIGLGAETAVASFVLWRRLIRGGWHRAAERCRADLAAEHEIAAPASCGPDSISDSVSGSGPDSGPAPQVA